MRTEREIEADISVLEEKLKPLKDELRRLREQERMGRTAILREEGITMRTVMSVDVNDLDEKEHRQCFSFLEGMRSRGIWPSGYRPEAGGQICVQISLDQKRSLSDQLAILEVLPHIRPVEGWRRIKIFRFDLSAAGHWELWVRPDTEESRITDLRWSRLVPEREFTAVIDAMEYIYEQHPYILRADSRWRDHGRFGEDD